MSIYHQIFNTSAKWNSIDDIQRLEPFMFLEKPIVTNIIINESTKVLEEIPESINEKQHVENEKDIMTNLITRPSQYYPKKPDSLFWCIYIAVHGYKEYNQISHRYSNVEIEEKQKMMELMKKTPNTMKNTDRKITKVLAQEIMSDFMTNKRITMDMLLIYAIYHNKKIVLINVDENKLPNKYYIIFSSQNYSETIIIYKKNNFYGLEMNYNEENLQNILTNLFCVEQIDKPLKAISNYKIDDLEKIAYKLNVDYTSKKLKKNDLYNAILLELVKTEK
jgi:hypothetical protein